MDSKFRKFRKSFRETTSWIPRDFSEDLETRKEYTERWISIYIIYFTMFLISLGFSIILTGVWPYLDKLDPSAGKEFMGYIVAANPFAQMLFSPLVGWWSNKLGTIRLPLLLSIAIFILASATYSSLELFEENRKYWMLFSRFLVGISSANIAACRSYLSAATRFSERTKAVSMISLAQTLGFVIGPALQTLVVPFGDDGVWLIKDKLKLNMYTASGWINVLLSILNFILFLPFFFKEHKIAVREAMQKKGLKNENDTWKNVKQDYLSSWTLIVAFFVLVFNFMLLETLGTSLTMDQFSWTKSEALYYMGILMSIGAIIACITFTLINPLCKKFPEVKVMIWGGFLFMVLGRAVYIPWGNNTPNIFNETQRLNAYNESAICNKHNELIGTLMNQLKIQNLNLTNESGETDYNNTKVFNTIVDVFKTNPYTINFEYANCTKMNEDDWLGCPSTQTWCYFTRAMTFEQFVLGYILTVLGYPVGVTLIQTIFSKILGPRPQGVWMGLMTGSGCLSRVMGPVFVTYIYTEFGTNLTFGFTTAMMVLSMIWLLWVSKRLTNKLKYEETGTELRELNNFESVCLNEIDELKD